MNEWDSFSDFDSDFLWFINTYNLVFVVSNSLFVFHEVDDDDIDDKSKYIWEWKHLVRHNVNLKSKEKKTENR